MRWNWQQPDWPRFRWDWARLAAAEARFSLGAGVLIGTSRHIDGEQLQELIVEGMSGEALTTSEIEGEFLDRASVQSSLQRRLGLRSTSRKTRAAEDGIAALLVDLYRSVAAPLSHEMLWRWQGMLLSGRKDLHDLGRYRTSAEPMQVVSGADYAPKVHFEAPPSRQAAAEMERFLEWFNRSAPDGPEPLPPLTRAGIAHLHFEPIHPFEDGNGRVGRAIAEKALIQAFEHITLIALGAAILAHHRAYYQALEEANKRNEVTRWLVWFGAVALEAQARTTAQVEFLIEKTKLLDRIAGRANTRQKKVLLRMLAEGPEGFQGGLSAGKYCTIAGTSTATATRDLAELLDMRALTRTGERKYARYWLNIKTRPLPRFQIDETGAVQELDAIPPSAVSTSKLLRRPETK